MAIPTVLRRLIWLLLLALIVAAAVVLVVRRRAAVDDAAYRTSPVDRGDITMTVTATGSLSAVTTVQVGSQVSGIIRALYADFNTAVRQGQVLAELDPTPFQAQVEQRRADVVQAEVQLRNAEIAFHRQERLLASGLTSQAEYDAAEAAADGAEALVGQARAALTQSETNLSYTVIRSPIDGVVVSRQYDVGQTVAASFQAPTLFTIAQDLTRMQAEADVDQADIGRVHVGQVARFTVDAYPEDEFRGTITQVRLNATINQNVVTYPVIIEVANPDGRLRPEMTADVTIEVATVHDVLRVPNAALRFRPIETGEGPEAAAAAGSPRGGGAGSPMQGPAAGPGRGGLQGQRPQGIGEARPGPALEAGGDAEAGPLMRTVYLLDAAGELEPVRIRTGVSDGRSTEVTGGDLVEGDEVVVGLATVKINSTGGRPPMRGF
ncbi:MAG TPA: efflux RND transporter periplasmic adaptor subunit [Thermoanaerobaculales bacterium]|nr:efflux RND transporter periplasmic adaptor subunit [Thermoanaerobaculales bacterium]HPA82118.1 efflux RND transporter periplasmic adaptor subunit [Thermoanaerobaculales bacterium]HQL30546.1 efflux RND transporter periplasmic adaptor subunit [Thermoanaerobaculales bacterium]HQN96858.1 efflux RND transporter periplasmic adaptor subunit [Thermoanaerobaculales bacterium]